MFLQKLIGISIISILLMFTLTSCEVKEVEFGNIESFNIVKIDQDYITVNIAARIKNPNSFGFTISKVDLDLSFNGFDLGKINKIKKVKVKKNSNDIKNLIFKIELKNIVKGSMLFIPALLTNKVKIKITGYVKASKFPISKKIEVNYNQNTKISKDFM
jgi:LEA14-like dessication related protein